MEIMQNTIPSNTIKGWDFTKQEIVDAIQNCQALSNSLDFTNTCDLNCPYCYIESVESQRKQKKTNELSLAESLSCIDAFWEIGGKTITIPWAWEPTLDPYLKEKISYIHQKGQTTVLFTNGKHLAEHPDLIDFFYENDVSVVIKLNSFNSEFQDLLAGKKGYTKQRDKALELLIAKGFTKSIPTRLGIDAITLKNTDELLKIHTRCRENNIFPIITDYIPTGRTDNGEFNGRNAIRENFTSSEQNIVIELLQGATSEEKSQLLKDIAEKDTTLWIGRTPYYAYYCGSSCGQEPWMYVDIEGNMYPCVARKQIINGKQKDWKLWNIRENTSIKDVWRTSPYLEERRKTFNGWCPYKYIYPLKK